VCNQAIKTIQARIKQHKDNLAGWYEGEVCMCVTYARQGLSDLIQARPSCASCHGAGRVNVGYLVPTDPDPEDREQTRRDLRVAISELEAVLTSLLPPNVRLDGWEETASGGKVKGT